MKGQSEEAIFGLYANGASVTEIAGQLSCSTAEVQSAIHEALASRPHIERRENRVSWELHRAVVEKLDGAERTTIIQDALAQAGVMKARQRSPLARRWMERWEDLLRGDLNELKTSMLEVGHDSEDLRQMSPFTGVLSQEERITAIKKATICYRDKLSQTDGGCSE